MESQFRRMRRELKCLRRMRRPVRSYKFDEPAGDALYASAVTRLHGEIQHWIGFREGMQHAKHEVDPAYEEMAELRDRKLIFERPEKLIGLVINALAKLQGTTPKKVWHDMRATAYRDRSVGDRGLAGLIMFVMAN